MAACSVRRVPRAVWTVSAVSSRCGPAGDFHIHWLKVTDRFRRVSISYCLFGCVFFPESKTLSHCERWHCRCFCVFVAGSSNVCVSVGVLACLFFSILSHIRGQPRCVDCDFVGSVTSRGERGAERRAQCCRKDPQAALIVITGCVWTWTYERVCKTHKA